MFNFIPSVRTDRFREIEAHKKNGCSFISEGDYILIDKIQVISNDEVTYNFELRVTFNEVKFYIIEKNSCIYLSFYEIYLLLKKIENVDIVRKLKELLDKMTLKCEQRFKKKSDYDENKEDEKFFYKGIEYEIPIVEIGREDYDIRIYNSELKVKYSQLFCLISLMQEKSNYLWSLSENGKEYTNGILRLLIVLLEYNDKHKKLEEIGWTYDKNSSLFIENKLTKKKTTAEDNAEYNKKIERKYYLTKREYDSIMSIES